MFFTAGLTMCSDVMLKRNNKPKLGMGSFFEEVWFGLKRTVTMTFLNWLEGF